MVPKILRRHAVEQLVGLSCSTIYAMMDISMLMSIFEL